MAVARRFLGLVAGAALTTGLLSTISDAAPPAKAHARTAAKPAAPVDPRFCADLKQIGAAAASDFIALDLGPAQGDEMTREVSVGVGGADACFLKREKGGGPVKYQCAWIDEAASDRHGSQLGA